MLEHTVVEQVRKAVQQQRAQILGGLADGEAKDFAQYKYIVGQLEGLAIAEGAVVEALKNEFKDED